MSKSDFPYQSLHDYLDSVFKEHDPTDEQTMQAKKDYWKQYNTNLKRRRRSNIREFLVGFSKEETQKLTSLITTEKGVAPLIRTIVLDFLDQNMDLPIQRRDTKQIEQSLALIIAYLEELLEDATHPHHIQHLIERITHLENSIHDY